MGIAYQLKKLGEERGGLHMNCMNVGGCRRLGHVKMGWRERQRTLGVTNKVVAL